MEIKTVFFDIGGVIIDNPHSSLVEYCEDYFKKDKDYKKADFSKFKSAFNKYYPQFQTGLGERVFWYRVLSECNNPSGVFLWHEIWGDACVKKFKHREFILNLIKELSGKRYKLGIISNIEVPSLSFLFASIWGKYYYLFDKWIFSCYEGMLKPDMAIYKLALKELRSAPEETIFIDDKIENCVSAEMLGINTIHYTGYDDFENRLYGYLK